jgi:aminoglycoside phosphotransferase (APT) family kinase protein
MAKVLDVEAQVDRLEEDAAAFRWMLPAERERIALLERELTARLRRTAPSRRRLIHGDFHGDNVLVAGARLVLLDFEDCAVGEPADDVGSNWAQLTWHEHKAGVHRALVNDAKRAFVEGYLAHDAAGTDATLATYAAMHCLLFGQQCLRHPLKAARFDDARAMLAACEGVLERGLQ